MSTRLEVYCDFDGTITQGDTVDVLLEAIGDPSWRAVEERWERGEIGSRECMALQIPLIRGGWKAIESVLAGVKIDPTFADFARWCRQGGIPLRIVSDGIDRVIHHLLSREGIRVDYVLANHLLESPQGDLSLTFPYAPVKASCSSGMCKCQVLSDLAQKAYIVVIGDGRSDFCWAPEADLLFAKSKLLAHCQRRSVPCVQFENFKTVRAMIEQQAGMLVHPVPQFIPGAPVVMAT